MRLDCTTDRYEQLYARWLVNPGSLLDLAGYVPGQRLLDLCGGSGAVSKEALRRGADPSTILLVDLNPRCSEVPSRAADCNQLGSIFGNADLAVEQANFGTFDLVVCRQALAYLDFHRWPGRGTPIWLRTLLKFGGKFVFNTFSRPKFALKTYKFEGRRFVEASGFRGQTVWHLQAGWGLGYDVTRFHWYTEADLRRIFEPHFDCVVTGNEKSQRWLCTRRVR